MCSDLIARRLGSTSCSHVYLRDGLHVTYHNALPISTLRIAAKQNRARGNLQPARAGGKHGFSPALTTTGMASTHIGAPCSRALWSSSNQSLLGFRHVHATLLSELGEPLKTSQAILGHSDMQTTLQVYTHAVSESVLRAEERLAKAVLDSIGPKSRKAVSRKTE